jgi:hypothetical protein
MGSQKQQGIALDPASVQPLVDGLLCRAPTSRVGALVDAAVTAVTSPPTFVYCHVWSGAERTAFWRGLLDRIGEFGAELYVYFVWFKKAFFFGEKEGDFAQAWESFASGIGDLATLAGKLAVVAGIPSIMLFHPKRRQYEEELKNLGLQITKEFLNGYKEAYRAGGIPQCTGRLLADLLRLVFELLAAKGAGKVAAGASKLASSGKLGAVLEKLPGPLKKLPAKMAEKPTRWQLVDYLTKKHHSEKTAIYARGVLRDVKPGEYLIRVEARADTGAGNWFNGPFRTPEEARKYAQYLADLGEDGIRRESALPEQWVVRNKDNSFSKVTKGNQVEVIRVYKVKHESPAIASHAAKQEEGAVLDAAGKLDPAKAGKKTASHAGEGQQLVMPVWEAKQVHGIDLVERVSHMEIPVKKNAAKKP